MTSVLQFFPDVLDVNGDGQNALVLAQRARWAGLEAELRVIALGDPVPADRPAAIVLGSSVDAELERVREGLAPFEAAMRDWVADGVPLVAVGTGFELLTSGIQLAEGGAVIEGLGILPGRAVPGPDRITGDLVIDSSDGRIVGFENHARRLLLPADAPALGTVVVGTGNDGRSEGARSGRAWGTHLHGPVLAKNPILADAVLRHAFGEAYRPDAERIRFVDDLARGARERILTSLGLEPDR